MARCAITLCCCERKTMNYIQTNTLQIFSLAEVRAAYPNMSIPDGADLSEFGLEVVQEMPIPVAPEWSVAEPGAPQALEQGWRTTWVIREMTGTERSAYASRKIEQIEDDSRMPRIVREMTLMQIEAWATGQGYPLPAFRLANKGYRLLKEADELIETLRGYIL